MMSGQPLREAVSWNNAGDQGDYPEERSQPLREAVSWNSSLPIIFGIELGQPLREAVSWNTEIQKRQRILRVSLFVRLWVEITIWIRKEGDVTVSLFVRLWVEIMNGGNTRMSRPVSLFVRLWVEMDVEIGIYDEFIRQPLREAVSWNNIFMFRLFAAFYQPLREAVSWNKTLFQSIQESGGQPLREAVSWNNLYDVIAESFIVSLFVRLWVEIAVDILVPPAQKSASSWGCELKFCCISVCDLFCVVSLFVRLWVEIEYMFWIV